MDEQILRAMQSMEFAANNLEYGRKLAVKADDMEVYQDIVALITGCNKLYIHMRELLSKRSKNK